MPNFEKSEMVSVLLPTYNSEKFVLQAVSSVLTQSYRNFEILVLDDGSTDKTVKLIRQLDHPRIRIFAFPKNRGLPAVLNSGISSSKGAFLARLDSDDLCAPRRLELQVNFLRDNPHVGIIGGSMAEFGDKQRLVRYPESHDEISCAMLFRNVIAHGTVMLRAEVFQSNSLRYSEDSVLAQDYELWSRLLKLTEFANLREVLVFRRLHNQQVTKSNKLQRRERYFTIRKSMAGSIGVPALYLSGRTSHPIIWLTQLARWNHKTKRFHGKLFWSQASKFLLVELKEAIAKVPQLMRMKQRTKR